MYAALKLIVQRVDGKYVAWRVDDTVNLRIQGVDVSVKEVQIKTNGEGSRVFKTVLREFFVDETVAPDVAIFRYKIAGVPVIVTNDKFNLLHRAKIVKFQDLALPVYPLREAKALYDVLDDAEKVAILNNHFTLYQ